MLPTNKTINDSGFTVRQKNEILTYLKALVSRPTISDTRYGDCLNRISEDHRYISVRFTFDIPAYSIFLVKRLPNDEFYHPIATADGLKSDDIYNPDIELDKNRYVYCTNGSTAIVRSSSSSSTSATQISSSSSSSNSSSSDTIVGTLQCHIIDKHRPHLARFSDNGPHNIGDRMKLKNDGSMTLEADPVGVFTCDSLSDDERKLVWVSIHHQQQSYIPWVITTTNSSFSSYPATTTSANTFVVKRGTYNFVTSSTFSFSAVNPPEYYIALSPCGWISENTITRMSRDYGLWYLFRNCKQSSSSSSSSKSSSSFSLSSSSFSSSSLSSPSISSGRSTCLESFCTFRWQSFLGEFQWVPYPTPGSGVANECEHALHPPLTICRCPTPIIPGTFDGEIKVVSCIQEPV